MTGSIDRVEVITLVQRRQRWSTEEKARIAQETYVPSLVARQHGVAPNQVSPGDVRLRLKLVFCRFLVGSQKKLGTCI
jgi:hypothetical protein